MNLDKPDSMKQSTIANLRQSARNGATSATVSLFVTPTKNEPVDSLAKRLIGRAGLANAVNVVQVHPLAGSFSVRGNPDAIAKLVEADEIHEALYSQQPDVLPKPVKRRKVDIESDDDDGAFVPYKEPPPSRPSTTERRRPDSGGRRRK